MTTSYSIAIAGSTERTVICAQALLQDQRFKLAWILTPRSKAQGRQKVITPNPMQRFAVENKIPIIFVTKKIDSIIQTKISTPANNFPRPDFLLVVDFGFLIPNWLLKIPKIAALNIHPSQLPRWRGSSPGQLILLNGEKQSAVSLIKMNEQLDQGPIIKQLNFKVQNHWTQTEYYQTSFQLMAKKLAQLLVDFSQGKIKAKKQPIKSPTPLARQLKKTDAFIDWSTFKTPQKKAARIERACRAFQPWPILWTIIPTKKGPKKMKIWRCHLEHQQKLILDEVQIEGQVKAKWNQIKNIFFED